MIQTLCLYFKFSDYKYVKYVNNFHGIRNFWLLWKKNSEYLISIIQSQNLLSSIQNEANFCLN